MRKFIGLYIATIALMSFGIGHTSATASTGVTNVHQTIYMYALSGNIKALQKLKASGYDLEATNPKGNTALCSAVLLKDVKAYNTLVEVGADLNSECMEKISPKNKDAFCAKNGIANKSICSIGKGKLGSNIWTTVGGAALLGTVGIAAAAGGGGGGGGSGSGEPPVDLCANVDCGEHGTCSAGICTCSDGYYGDRCDKAPLTCENGGTWNETTLRCDCINGYYGDTCSREPLACENGGTWNEVALKCDCPEGFIGQLCEIVDACYTMNCGEHGTCNLGVCTCLDNYYGDLCENAPLTCQNGGNWDTTAHECVCVNGWTGATCEIEPDPCYNVDCGVHGACQDKGGVGVCVCSDDFKGDHCEIPPETKIETITSIPVAIPGTSQDGTIINGVYTNPQYSRAPDGVNPDYVAGTEKITEENFENDSYKVGYLAEFGGVKDHTSSDVLVLSGNDDKAVVGLWANGVGSDAIPPENLGIVMLDKASKVSNAGEITMDETASTNKGIMALKGTSAGTVSNTGKINLTTRSENQSAALFASGLGWMVQNAGSITLNALDKSKNVSGIWAKDRQVLTNNTSVIDIILGKGVGTTDEIGEVIGIYGKTLVNRGTINASVNASVAEGETVKTNVYAMKASGAGNASNDGTINLNLTNMLYDVYGVSADADAFSATLTNKGTIKATGKLYNDPTISKQIVLLGTYKGMNDTILNEGTIEADIDVSNGGKLALMQGNSGTVTNNADLILNLGFTSGSTLPFDISAMSAQSANLSNKGNIDITVSNGNTSINSVVTAMGGIYDSSSSSTSNSGKINITSSLNGLRLTALGPNDGAKTNDKTGEIYITTDAEDSTIDTTAGSGSARNDGIVVLKHNGGSGDIIGFGGGNSGELYIYANDMTKETNIVGLTTAGGDNSDASSALIDIHLTGGTHGNVAGTDSSDSFKTSNIVKLTATDDKRNGNLSVYGHIVDNMLTEASFTRTGNTIINVTGKKGYDTYVTGITSTGIGSLTEKATITNNGHIDINVDLKDSTSHQIVGIADSGWTSSENPSKAINNGVITLKVTGNHNKALDSTAVPFDVVGMATASYAENSAKGVISIEVDGNAKAAGMVAFDGGSIHNHGTIKFNGDADNFTAFYATGEREHVLKKDDKGFITKYEHLYATVHNSGNIIINGNKELFDINAYGKGYENPVREIEWAKDTYEWKTIKRPDGSTYEGYEMSTTTDKFFAFNNPLTGTISILNAKDVITLNDGMGYVSEKGGVITALNKHLLGSVIGGSSLVQNGFNDTYIGNGQGNGAIVSDGNSAGLALTSGSAMFDAGYALNENNSNGLDIVMTRRSFADIVKNDSLAHFLENNYKGNNNESFFNKLKGFGDVGSLTAGLNSLTGQDMLSRFNFEDMTMMRELNFDMNDKLFHNKEQSFSLAGSVSPMAFKGDTGSNARYSLFNKRQGKFSLGLGVAFTDVRSDDDHNDNARSETMYQLVVPMGYKTHGFNLVTSPRLGYARGSYDRTGFEGKSYDGTIEKRVFGLMNEARYPMTFGDWSVEPSAEFNVIGYQQKGSEDAKEYSLNIKSQKTYSVEGGFGLYLNKVKELAKDKTLKLNLGASVYHEFADPYQLEVGLTGMDGSFMLRDEERSDNRAVVRAGFDYAEEDYSIYGSFISYIDREVRTALKSGFKWKF